MVVTRSAAPMRPALSTGWDSDVFVLRGDDRTHLRNRAIALASFIDRQPSTELTHLAASLAAELQPGGSRLAVVATSLLDLQTKLRRAADRLADQKCRHIRDSAGVYFFEQPLFEQGSLALLFPGEGAQYPNMLRDLCGVFPEVENTFAWCDQLAAEAGQPSLRGVLHPSPDKLAEAEAELRKLGPSIFGVLIADMAIIKVLWNFQLPVSAVAGHSAGELAALLAAGAMNSEEVLGHRLSEIMELMQQQEDEAGGPDIALLAIGGGKATVVEIAKEIAGGEVIVAMDNCPHQCVAVGPTNLVAKVESALLGRGLVCERLPFRRPYHTPLFEQWMPPFRELFKDVPFAKPHTPVYCCSTGEKFPDDPDTIHHLTVNHWVTPVEFARMIETMYADGVRVFVEAGPRGNLSAFVEDVLRGRPFIAIPANLPRKSGPTQINHLVAQLVAHHVPFNVGHLFHGRETRGVEWEAKVPDSHATEGDQIGLPRVTNDRHEGSSENGPGEPYLPAQDVGSSAAIMNSHLAVMEQFLDVQREVMQAFLSGRAAPVSLPSDLFAIPDFAPVSGSSTVVQDASNIELPTFALIGHVEHHEPGRSIVTRRMLDEREDRYVDDHTLGGRGVSRVDPSQNGLPVLPMTFSLEAMAAVASALVPGKIVVGIKNVRLYRWLPFDADPTTLEVRASVNAVDPESGLVEVKADVRDLGNSFLRDGANKPSSEAIVVLADRYPEAPALRPFQLTDEQLCKSTVEDLRRNMFHGPLFHMIRTLGRIGKEGIEGTLEVQPRDGWLRSNSDPRVVIDPVLVDAAMHILGAWHLEQPDWSGRILLPIGVQSLEFFGPPPAVGSHFTARGHNEEETARQVRHGLEVFDSNGRLWLRMTGAAYWRFYLPFGDVNFFGPKDQYYLSSRWPEAEVQASVATRCYFLDPPADLQQPVLRASGVRVTMTPREIAAFQAWTGTDAERSNWFFSRLVAKDAARATYNERHGGGVFPADIETDLDESGRLVCRSRGEPIQGSFPPVAVAVLDGKVAAFAAFSKYVGIAMIAASKDKKEQDERSRAARLAVADALRITPDSLKAEQGAAPGLCIVLHEGQKLRVQTARRNDLIVATTLCEAEPT